MFMTSPQATIKLNGELTMTTGIFNDDDGYYYETGVGSAVPRAVGTWTISSIAGITFDNFYMAGIYGGFDGFYITVNSEVMEDAWTQISWTTAAGGGNTYDVLSADATYQQANGGTAWYY